MGRLQFAVFLLIVCMSLASIGVQSTCKEAERAALLKLKHTFSSLSFVGGSRRLASWVGDDCCSWKGVECDNVTTNVFKLDLGGGDLKSGGVSPALLELKYLTYLDLSGNYFNGSSIPEFIGSMKQLRYLNLSNTGLGGQVPLSLGSLKKLVVLDLNNHLLYRGYMETNSLEWAFKLENLEYLDLSQMNMSQALDSLDKLLNLPSLSVLNLTSCNLGNSHLVIRNSTVSSSPLQHLDLGGNLFSGPFPHFIQNLSSLRFLDLSWNRFNSSVPSWLGNHIHLTHVDLGGNAFSGSFPSFIQNLSSLRFLDLSMNRFSSSVPSWLGNQVNLTHVDLGGNAFSGSFPSGIQNLSYITFLSLSDNQFRSSIPPWLASKTVNLEYLSLGSNHFDSVDGGIMNTISHLCNLKYLNLSDNQLQEGVSNSRVNFSRCSMHYLEFESLTRNNFTMPIRIGTFSSLQNLDLSLNNLETLPPSLGRLSSLVSLDMSHNHLSVVNQVSLANLSSLKNLDLSSNSLFLNLSSDWLPPFQLETLLLLPCKMNSPFPKWLLTQKRISYLDLSDTGIFGPLPSNIGNDMPSLSSLRLANNRINGSIPRSLCELANLNILDLQKNRLSGMIPDCWANSPILALELSSNRLFGHIPNSLTSNLKFLSLNNNSLEGELPLSLSNCVQLLVLDVGWNNLNGGIPTWSGADFPNLQILILRQNRFKGIIPPQLCSVHTLQIIDLASNNLGGTIPQCFGHFKGTGSTEHPSNSFASPPGDSFASPPSDSFADPLLSPVAGYVVEAPMNPDEWSAVEVIKGEEREYTKVLHLLVNMDLSSNNLVGVIPTEITTLRLLFGLNLSYNHLNGTIPKEIGRMKAMESLDLSHNNISGSIPESISSLTFLSTMDLSFNNLQGQIPTGTQLGTLNDSSYIGNSGLCGDPLPKKCFRYNIAQSPTSTTLEDEDNKHEKIWLYLVIILGFATGFWGVIGVLVVKRRWRHAYFQLAEHLGDWIYVRVAVRIVRAKGRN